MKVKRTIIRKSIRVSNMINYLAGKIAKMFYY